MSTYTLTIPAPLDERRRALWINANDRTHWAVKARLTKQWRNMACAYAASEQLPKGLSRVHVTATVHKTRNGRWDVHNVLPSVKAAIDGLVDYGLIDDDDNAHLTGPDMRAGEKRDRAQIILTITEVPNART